MVLPPDEHWIYTVAIFISLLDFSNIPKLHLVDTLLQDSQIL